MLLQQILKYTPENHVDYQNLKNALTKLKKIIFEINLIKR